MLLLLQRYFQVTLKNLKKDVKELEYSFILVGFSDSGYLAKYISMWGHYTKHTSMTKSSLAELRAAEVVVSRSYHVEGRWWILTVDCPGASVQDLDVHLFLCNFRNVFFPSQAHTILCILY